MFSEPIKLSILPMAAKIKRFSMPRIGPGAQGAWTR